MKKILILGAGMVSRPIVRYLLEQKDFFVCQASRTVEKAESIINGHSNGKSVSLNISDDEKLENLIKDTDLVVSLLPYTYHVKVANLCIKHKKHLVTTSYVSDEMEKLDSKAKKVGIILLNECGLDPGIDHMSAMRIIHNVKKKNGKIICFRSTTGALPSYESNNNPFGYKFSWSPRGVLLASRNPAKWLENGEIIDIPGEKLFENYNLQDVKGVGTFENYPNRNSVPYKDIYELKDAKTVYRGTFRNPGWCETLKAISRMGWLNEEPINARKIKTYADLTRNLIGAGENDDLEIKTSEILGFKKYSAVVKRLKWLGLFSDKKLPNDKDCPLDYLNFLTLEKMPLKKHEQDMVVMHHEFIIEYPNKKECITSTLFEKGNPDGDSAVSKTVALPAAIAVKMILRGIIDLKGVYIPVIPELYNPILDELEKMGVSFKENKKDIKYV